MTNLRKINQKIVEKTMLKDVCFLEIGEKVKKGLPNYLEIGDVDIVNKSYDISQKNKLTVSGSVNVPKETLLISKVRPTRGAITITRDNVNVSNAFCRIKLENRYLYYILSRENFFEYLGSCSTGSTYPTCKDEDILNYCFYYNKDEKVQKEITEIFLKVDEDIEATEEVIKKTEKLKKGLMQELLTKGIGHKKFKKTKLGIIPESWEVEKLNDLCIEIKGGGTPSRKVKKYWNGKVNWATVKDLKKEILLKNTKETITFEGVDASSTCIIPRNSIITSTRMGIGRFYINKIDVAINQDLKGIILDKKVDLRFMLWKFLSLKEHLESLGTGTTVKGIKVDVLKNLELAIPKFQEQKEIASILSKIYEKIEVYQEIRKKLEKLKKGLMQDLLK